MFLFIPISYFTLIFINKLFFYFFMKTQSIKLKDFDNEFMRQQDVLHLIYLSSRADIDSFRDFNFYHYRGNLLKPVEFKFNVQPEFNRWDEVKNINDVDFVSKALSEIKNYVSHRDDVYRLVEKEGLKNESGKFLFAKKNEALYEINVEENNYISKKIKISSIDNLVTVEHIPNFGINSSVDLNLSVEKGGKYKLLPRVYGMMIDEYKKNRATVVKDNLESDVLCSN